MPWNCCIHVVCTATDLTTGSPQQATVVISSLMLSSPPCGLLATLLSIGYLTPSSQARKELGLVFLRTSCEVVTVQVLDHYLQL
jgi:hypothetical protein